MDFDTFRRSMEWVRYYAKNGYQPELSITGIGEALLHPQFLEFMEYARSVYQNRLLFSTNGIGVTKEIAKALKSFGVDVYVSLHRPELAAPAINHLRSEQVSVDINNSAATDSFDWAGKVKWFVTANPVTCSYLKNGWGVVLQNGNITTCCMDSEEEGVVGHVNDEIDSVEVQPYSLCKTCHMQVEYS